MERKLNLDDILKNCNHYDYTVSAVLCFISLVCWERYPEPKYSFGRRMSTSPNNKIKKSGQVTPDAVIQLSETLGLIVEIKCSLPMDNILWEKEVLQLLKYNDCLEGWWTPNEQIDKFDVVMLIDQTRCIQFRDYLVQYLTENEYDNKTCGISFNKTTLLSEQLWFEFRWGTLKDQQLTEKLKTGISIPLERVKQSYGNIKFYDSDPQIEYLISIIWNDVLNVRKIGVTYDASTKSYPINITIEEIATELQKSFGCIALYGGDSTRINNNREVVFPKVSWVRKALDLLVDNKYATKNINNEYIVYYRLIRKDIIQHFARYTTAKKSKKEEVSQPRLFDDKDFL